MNKRCCKCKEKRSPSEFHRSRNTKDGLDPRCKACRTAYNKKRWVENRDEVYAKSRAWIEANPEKVRAMHRDWYRRNPEKAKARSERHKARQRELQREWFLANRDRHRETSRLSAARRRARIRNATVVDFSKEELAHRLSMFSGCWVCGDEASQVDHVKPLAKGGAHCLSNLRPICGNCNASKNATWPYTAPERG